MQIEVASFASSQMANAITGTARPLTARFFARLLFYRRFSEHAGEWQRQAKPPLACHFAAGIKREKTVWGNLAICIYFVCCLSLPWRPPMASPTDASASYENLSNV